MSAAGLTPAQHYARLTDDELVRKAQPHVYFGQDPLAWELAERLKRAIRTKMAAESLAGTINYRDRELRGDLLRVRAIRHLISGYRGLADAFVRADYIADALDAVLNEVEDQ